MDAIFCYRISKEANLAYDTKTGEPEECYMRFSIKDNNEKVIVLTEEEYKEKHPAIARGLASDMGLNPDWLEPISIEEYKENMDEEE